jgi:hypothetical protein
MFRRCSRHRTPSVLPLMHAAVQGDTDAADGDGRAGERERRARTKRRPSVAGRHHQFTTQSGERRYWNERVTSHARVRPDPTPTWSRNAWQAPGAPPSLSSPWAWRVFILPRNPGWNCEHERLISSISLPPARCAVHERSDRCPPGSIVATAKNE